MRQKPRNVFVAVCLLVCLGRADGASGQLLRVPNVYSCAERSAAFWRALDARAGTFSDLALFTRWSNEARTPEFHRGELPRVRAFVEAAHQRGYRVGVNILPTVAFPEDYGVQRLEGARNRVTAQGVEQRGTLCLRSPVTVAAVREICAIYASAGVDFIYLDDDVDLAHCHCPDCCRRFSELSGQPVKGAADVRAALDAADPAVRELARNAWIDLADESRALLYSAAEQGAHGVSPKIELGCMTCGAAISDRAGELWSSALGGASGTRVRWRPGGGCWSDHSRGELLTKLEHIGLQVRGVPAAVEIQAELECFPYHGLLKSPGFLGYEALLYVAWGCDSVAFNMLGGDPGSLDDEFRGYLDRAQTVAPELRRLRTVFAETPSEGFAYAWGRFALTAPSRGWRDWQFAPMPNALEPIGLPAASDPARASVLLVDRATAEGLSSAALTNVLSGGAYLDAGALEVLTDRGFGEFVGFAVSNSAPRTAGFRDLGHPLNLPGCRVRRIRFSLDSGRESRVPLLMRTSARAEFVSESIASTFVGERLGFNGGVFENALGGRIAVCTQLPFSECESMPRAEHLKRTLRWLSREMIPGYVHSFHRVALRARGGSFFAANFATEALRDVRFALRGSRTYACMVYEGGCVRARFELKPERADGAYSVYRLPVLPNLGEVLMTPSCVVGDVPEVRTLEDCNP